MVRLDFTIKWAAHWLVLASSTSVVAIAKKVAKSEIKAVVRTISIPKTKMVNHPVQQIGKPPPNDEVGIVIKPVSPQKPLSNLQSSQ